MNALTRRDLLRLTAATAALHAPAARLLAAEAPERPRLVLLNLRGGVDALAVAAPYAEPEYAALRGAIALPAPGTAGGALKLDGLFALHPRLERLHARYLAGEALVHHAVATPYRDRSHFDAQDVLENGTATPGGRTGWLNRAVAAAPGLRVLTAGPSVPLVARGPAPVESWSPSLLPGVDEDTLDRIADLYARDPFFAERLESARAAPRAGTARRGRRQGITQLIGPVAERLRAPGGPHVVTLDWGGWDTHANQGGVNGGLATRLGQLDTALDDLAAALGSTWSSTVVLVVTEFGRTVRVNGTRGTDHGTGTLAVAVGGAVAGGRVLADWPGLRPDALHEGRDLRPTRDLRDLIAGVLVAHLGLDEAAVARTVFPGHAIRPLPLT